MIDGCLLYLYKLTRMQPVTNPHTGFFGTHTIDEKIFEDQALTIPRLAKLRTLELNADFQPLSYYPVSSLPWTKVVFFLAKGWAREEDGKPPIITVLEEYDEYVNYPSGRIKLPAVIAHTRMIPLPKKVPFTRKNVYLRDDFTCMYSGKKLPPIELTFDHVLPASRGGKTTWDNIVTCSKDINGFKANRTPKEAGLRLIKKPYIPDVYEIREKSKKHPPAILCKEWEDYLYWGAELEE